MSFFKTYFLHFICNIFAFCAQHYTQYGYESWHIRYVGKEAATKIYKNNWTLEEYHGSK